MSEKVVRRTKEEKEAFAVGYRFGILVGGFTTFTIIAMLVVMISIIFNMVRLP